MSTLVEEEKLTMKRGEDETANYEEGGKLVNESEEEDARQSAGEDRSGHVRDRMVTK
jgi:hypothetical protein